MKKRGYAYQQRKKKSTMLKYKSALCFEVGDGIENSQPHPQSEWDLEIYHEA
jgi:hypothetical protein